MSITLAVDAMGGDFGVEVTIPACCDFLQDHPDAKIVATGDAKAIEQSVRKCNPNSLACFQIVGASEIVLMDDPIEVALRRKKDSSMRVAIEQVRDGKADAVISAGNTGALMAISRYILKTLDGIDRPAIATAIPNELGKGTTVLDLGANADCEPIHLLQFAQMADVMLRVVNGNPQPSIGLLNIGEEVIKGNEVVKQTAELLRATDRSESAHRRAYAAGHEGLRRGEDLLGAGGVERSGGGRRSTSSGWPRRTWSSSSPPTSYGGSMKTRSNSSRSKAATSASTSLTSTSGG